MNPYATAAAFKQAVETRLRSTSSSGTDFARRRQLLVFDRFLARITRELGDSVILKGGLVVELRVDRARTTKDIDLRLVGPPTGLLERLRRAAELELGDLMLFTVVPDDEHPAITNEGMVYEGQRYRVTCALAGKPYGQPFGLDIAFADPIFGEPDTAVAADVLGFAGIEPPHAAPLPSRDPHRGEAPRLDASSQTSELAREGPPRHRAARRCPRDRGHVSPRGARPDLHLAQDPCASGVPSTAACRMGSTVRTHGRGGRSALGRSPDSYERSKSTSRPRARRQRIANLDAVDVAVGAVTPQARQTNR